MTMTGYHLAMEVTRDANGCYDVAAGAVVEDWQDTQIQLDLTALEDHGPLTGWAPWARAVSAVDADGYRRRYFLR